jgi:hypothetical protein
MCDGDANSVDAIAADKPAAERLEPSRLADVVEYSEPLTTPAPQVVVSRRATSNTISTRQDTGTPPRPSLWSRVWRSARRVVTGLSPRPAPRESRDMWNKVGSVAIILDGQEIPPVAAIILLDPGCEDVNLISTGMMRRAGRNYDTASGVHIGSFLDGRECWSLGEVCVRWYTEDYRMLFEDATCHVVDTIRFDLLIGKADIDRLQLFKPNRRPIGRISALFTTRPEVKGTFRSCFSFAVTNKL